ncbi:MAG: demethylmenaquinone methyltransferase/2-methoxy-6-polyprenyl-1,4-benzoquinol methylase [Maribacter sp.]|jgi:demethylmenaquinone methyltransferase/2-methoxy-6-polyprenyl-1,4-benzoquinol methylase
MSEHIKPYSEEDSKKGQISKMFNNIAPYYDFLNRLLSLRMDVTWRRKAIAKLKADKPQMILDMATGTGDVALEAYKQLKPKQIIGMDISTEMLEVGKVKIKKKGLDKIIEMKEGDSENLPFEDNTFDAVTVAFGVRNYENLEKGMREMNRVLKPGGQLVVLEFSQPTIFPFKQLYLFYFKNILPLVGKLTSKDPKAYQYLYESVQAFPNGKDFVKVMDNTNYKNNEFVPLTLGICSIYTGRK